MSIRSVTPDDAATILELLRQLAAFEGGSVTAQVQDLANALAHGRLYALLAEQDGKAVGVLTLLPSFSSWRGQECAVIHDLFVTPEQRGAGIGDALIRAALDMAAQKGWTRMDVNVLDWNQPAQNFYRRFGLIPQADWRIWRIEGEALEKPRRL
ncbi:MAG: GNAT family N-acetyltransferase [Magnetospirillum gryphiswaldense]|nr:GNAT family N-acetyltransferase [Magnetospirillum gryphiswaldense]